MTSGYVNSGPISNTEILKIGNNAEPPQYPDHPRRIFGATGGFLNNDFLTCGGMDSVAEITDKCYMLGSEGPFATMRTKRWMAASIVLEDEKLWILGGISSSNSRLSSTEYIFSDGRNEEGPPMPITLESHAMVKINETTSFLVSGGNNDSWTYSKRTWFYNGKWIDGPDLEKGSRGLSLGIIRDSVTLHEYVVAAGGYDGFILNNAVEIMDVQENKWEPGNPLLL